jgi:hypothetical protein
MNRQFPGRDLHPLVSCALVAHLHLVVGLSREKVCFEIDITGEKWWRISLIPTHRQH